MGSSSSALSAVSAGLSNECTLLAMLDLRVAGADILKSFALAYLDAPKDQLLSADSVDGVVSDVRGGVGCLEIVWRRGPPNS